MDSPGVFVFSTFAAIALMFVLLAGFVVAMVFLSLTIFARFGGLTQLFGRYPAGHEPTGDKFTGQHAMLGAVRYRFCTTYIIGPEGLYMWVRPPLTKYPPVLIPWSEIKSLQETMLYWQKALRLTIGEPKLAVLTLVGRPATLVQQYLPGIQVLPKAGILF